MINRKKYEGTEGMYVGSPFTPHTSSSPMYMYVCMYECISMYMSCMYVMYVCHV